MRYSEFKVVLQEVPGEISLCFTITGCKLACDGCHSPYLWKEGTGKELTMKVFVDTINKYKNLASCVLFMGGEWNKEELISLLVEARNNNLKTCLYSGLNHVDSEIISELTFIKTGPWIKSLGGLDNINTNQKFINLETKERCNYLFIK